jgi:hypothetical protein
MSAWRQISWGFVSNILSVLFVAICVALGFGPTEWAEFLVAGMPIFVTTGIVRLILLLLASVTLASLLWNKIIESQTWLKIVFLITACLPFVAGSFYVTAVPRVQRHLSPNEIDRLVIHFQEIKAEVSTIPVAFAPEDEPATYADEFLGILDKVGIKYIQMQSYAAPNECGVMVGAKDPVNPSVEAKKVLLALRNSGLNPTVIPFQPRFDFLYNFDLFIGPPCR